MTSLLTLYALVEGVEQGVLADARGAPPAGAPARSAWSRPTAALVAVGLLLTVAAGPLYAYTERAAVSLAERTPYVDAVLPDGERGQGVSDDVAEDASP